MQPRSKAKSRVKASAEKSPDTTTIRIPVSLRNKLKTAATLERRTLLDFAVAALNDILRRYQASTGFDLDVATKEKTERNVEGTDADSEFRYLYIGCDRRTQDRLRTVAASLGMPMKDYVTQVLEREIEAWEKKRGIDLDRAQARAVAFGARRR